MKKLLLAGFIVYGFAAYADSNKGFFSFNIGLVIDPYTFTMKHEPRLSLSYGANIESQYNYFGFFELGIRNANILLLLKYGYEFMREKTFSFGIETALLLGNPTTRYYKDITPPPLECAEPTRCSQSEREEHEREIEAYHQEEDALGFGNELGAFVRVKITKSISTLVRAGVQQYRPFLNGGDWIFSPYADISARWFL